MRKSISCLLGAALTLFAAVTATQAAPHGGHGGGGGSGGGTSGGTIYFDGSEGFTSMNSDGSNQTLLGASGSPSQALLNGHRWFVNGLPFTGQVYPDGGVRGEIFAFRDDYDWATNNNASTRVQLTDSPLLEPWGGEWLPGDDFVSFIGRHWSSTNSDATVVEGGIYTATLVFDSDGNIVGLAAQPDAPTIPFPLVETAPGDFWPDVKYYSWAPAADMVAYSNYADNGLWIADLLGARIQIYNIQAHMAVWSPLGDKIAFTRGDGIHTINPDGTGDTLTVPDKSWFFHHAYFSPDGSQLVFNGQDLDNNVYLFSANAHRGGLQQLTSTPVRGVLEWEGGWVQ